MSLFIAIDHIPSSVAIFSAFFQEKDTASFINFGMSLWDNYVVL